ncbi:MAG: hypothetical protein V4671_08380 [Armatimonadota bacterium]
MLPDPDEINLSDPIILAGAIVGITDLIKKLPFIKGRDGAIRVAAYIVSFVLLFGKSYRNNPKPALNFDFFWDLAIYAGVFMTAAMGWHALRSGKSDEDGMLTAGNQGGSAKTARKRLKPQPPPEPEVEARATAQPPPAGADGVHVFSVTPTVSPVPLGDTALRGVATVTPIDIRKMTAAPPLPPLVQVEAKPMNTLLQ